MPLHGRWCRLLDCCSRRIHRSPRGRTAPHRNLCRDRPSDAPVVASRTRGRSERRGRGAQCSATRRPHARAEPRRGPLGGRFLGAGHGNRVRPHAGRPVAPGAVGRHGSGRARRRRPPRRGLGDPLGARDRRPARFLSPPPGPRARGGRPGDRGRRPLAPRSREPPRLARRNARGRPDQGPRRMAEAAARDGLRLARGGSRGGSPPEARGGPAPEPAGPRGGAARTGGGGGFA